MLQSKPLFHLKADVATPQVTPDGPYGVRRYITVTGGEFTGERVSGRLLSGGADCQLIRPDGVAELDVRVALETHDGAIIFMKGLGLRHGAPEVLARMARGEDVGRDEYYFREAMYFEAPEGAYDWMNRLLAVGIGERRPDSVHIEAFEIV